MILTKSQRRRINHGCVETVARSREIYGCVIIRALREVEREREGGRGMIWSVCGCMHAGYFWSNCEYKELRECEREHRTRSVRKNSRRLLRSYIGSFLYLYLSPHIFLRFPLSLSFSSEFQCGLPVISFSATDIREYPPYIRASRPCICRGTCIHASMYEDIPAHFATTIVWMTMSRLPRENNSARIILSNKIDPRATRNYTTNCSVVPRFFNREQIQVLFGYIDTRVSECVFFSSVKLSIFERI